MRKDKSKRKAFFMAIISSFFLLISGTNGVLNWTKLGKTLLDYVDVPLVRISIMIVLIISSLGAFSVFLGAILIDKRKYFWARLFIVFGSGAGLMGFILNLIYSFSSKDFSIYSYFSFSSLGIIFSILSQLFLLKKRKR